MLPAHMPEVIEPQRHTLPAPSIVDRMPSQDETPGSGIARKLLILTVIFGAIGFATWKIHANTTEQDPSGNKQAASGGRPVPVIVSPVQKMMMPIYLTELGTVEAYYSVTIKPRVDGQLMAVNVREGQSVHKGQLLAQIDPEPYKAALAQAEGQLAKDKAIAAYANTEAERYTALYNAGVVSQDSAQTLVSNAGQTAGAIQVDQAAIQAVKVSLAYTRLNSPIDGVVGLRQVDPGNIVHAADPTGLILVTQLQPISVIFTLPEDELPQVRQAMLNGPTLAVEAYDRSETMRLATGKLLTLDNQIDTATGTDKVKAVFDNKDNAMFPNQFVNVRLILQQRQDAIVIPSAAVQMGSQGSFVYVVKHGDPPKPSGAGIDTKTVAPSTEPHSEDDGGSEKNMGKTDKYYVEVRPIVLDVTEGSQVIVASGLTAGEQIVIDGQEKLKNGSRISPQQSTPKSGRGALKQASADNGATTAAQPAAESADGSERPKHHKQGQHP
jgi:membrane fusion protein, multidrug efflux system